jgi:NADPH:quinone reductase-like Zn-dependent oxidoreductase
MRAVVSEGCDPAEVIEKRETPRSKPAPDEVMVQVQAASVNAYDAHLLQAYPFLARLNRGLFRPRNTIS